MCSPSLNIVTVDKQTSMDTPTHPHTHPTHTPLYQTPSVVTYIQTIYKDQPIKVKLADKTFCKAHLKKPAKSSAYYTIVPDRLIPMKKPNRLVYIIMLMTYIIAQTSS